MPVAGEFQGREARLTRAQREIFRGVRRVSREFLEGLEFILAGAHLVEEVQQRPSHRVPEEIHQVYKSSGMSLVETLQIEVLVRRQYVDRRPVVLQEVQVEEQSAHPTVSVAEGMDRFEPEMHPSRNGKYVLPQQVLLCVPLDPLVQHRDNSLHSRRHVPTARDPDVHPPPLARVVLDPVEDRLVKFEDCGQPNRHTLSGQKVLERPGVLDRFQHVVKRMIRDASPFKQDPLDIPAVERISLDRVRAPRVKGACPLPHARWDCVERGAREEFLSKGLEYGFIHSFIKRHMDYINMYGISTSSSLSHTRRKRQRVFDRGALLPEYRPVECESQPLLVSPDNWVCRNRIVRCQASSAAGASYASGRSFSKNQCFVPGYVWNVTSFPLVVRRIFSRSCTTAGDSNSSVSAKCPRRAARIWE